MEGLEANETQFSTIQTGRHALRLDSEFFRKDWAAAHSRILSLPNTTPLWHLCEKITQGPNPDFVEEGIACLNGKNIYFGTAVAGEPNYVTPQEFRALEAFNLRPGDILITLKHATKVGRAWIKEDSSPAIFSRNLGLLRPAANGDIGAVALLFILWARDYQLVLDRIATGGTNGQITLATTPLKDLPIPCLSVPFQRKLEQIFEMARHYAQKASSEVSVAEQTLLRALGLEGWQPPEPLTYTRRASETFTVGRLDAERYQEKYYALASRLQAYPRGCQTLGEICPAPVNGVEIREYCEEGIPYLRVGDLKLFDVQLDSVKRVPKIEAKELIGKVALRKGDVLVSRSGSLAVIGVVEDEWADALISSHLIRVRIENEDFDPYYVALFLSAMPGRLQIDQRTNGGVQPEINQPALKSILLPKLNESDQKQIRACTIRSRETRHQARALLELAKHAVEVAIEKGEAAALALLDTTEGF